MTRRQAALDILLALLLTLAGGLVAGWLATLLPVDRPLPLVLLLVTQGLVVLGGLQALLSWRSERWRQLRLPAPQWRDLGRGLVALAAVFGINLVVMWVAAQLAPSLVESHQESLGAVAGQLTAGVSFAGVAGAMLFVGLYEELLARGLLLRRAEQLLGGRAIPVLISSLLFGLGHFYQGWTGVAQTTLVGIVFAAFALRWQSLWPTIIAHAGLNILSLLALELLQSRGA